MDKPSRHNNQVLIVRNFPHDFSGNDIKEFLNIFEPSEIHVSDDNGSGRVHFINAEQAKDVLLLLHQYPLNGQLLTVEYAQENPGNCIRPGMNGMFENAECINCARKNSRNTDIPDSIKRLYATADYLGFTQPVPPYLKYQYPLVNRDIIDAIGIALECSPKFYTQVLHLMNRMHLEPPFLPGAAELKYARTHDNTAPSVVNVVHCATQTDELAWELVVKHKRKCLASDESELESSSSNEMEVVRQERKLKRRRLCDDRSKSVKDKVRKILKNQQVLDGGATEKKSTAYTLDNIFELSTEIRPANIKFVAPINMPEVTLENEPTTTATTATTATSNENDLGAMKSDEYLPIAENVPTELPHQSTPSLEVQLIPDAEVNENRIPADQLRTHPLFQNYSAGTPSNKLYIKNIAKEVTLDDLKSIFYRYLDEKCAENNQVRAIDIRLMTTGRMKGQAFVTFSGPYLDDEEQPAATAFRIVERARRETNGLILKTKAIVVSFGKKSTNQ